MAKQEIKFKVTIKELSFEYEGSREVGQQLQAGLNRSLGTLLDTQRAAMALPATPAARPALFDADGVVDPPLNGQTANDPAATVQPPAPVPAPAAEKKRTRKSGSETAMSLLRGLIADGYFKEARTVDNIREKLRLDGHTNVAGLTARLPELAKKKELFRDETDDGLIYKDTPFNAAPGTPTPPVEPAE